MKVIALTLALITGGLAAASTANAGWTGFRNGAWTNFTNNSTGQRMTCSQNGPYINCY